MENNPKPPALIGLRHVALYVQHLEACVEFYTKILDMKLVWQPDADNYYLESHQDNLALHRAPAEFTPFVRGRLDHIGFFLKKAEDVDVWHNYLKAEGVSIKRMPKDHRDGSRSFYCADPDGNIVQMIYMGSSF